MPLYLSPQNLGRWLTPLHSGVASTSQTFTVGRVLLAQFVVSTACQIDGLSYVVGTTAAGSVVGGIVGPVTRSSDSADTAVVVAQSASTAQGATSAAQVLTWTAVTVQPGIYYACLEGSDVTGTYMRQANGAQAPGLGALYDRAGGYRALTNPTPTTTATGSALPGLRIRIA